MKISQQKLYSLMANRCVNPMELSEMAGIAYTTLKGSTNGRNTKPATVGKIAKALGVDAMEILDEVSA